MNESESGSGTVPPVQPAPPPQPPPPPPAADTRTWEMLCHLAAFAGFVVPFGNIIGPLIVWLVKRDQSAGVDAHGKESLNFQISWSIYGVVLGAMGAILAIILVGFLFFIVIGIGAFVVLILTIIGAVKANNGELYRYPLTIRFLK